MAQDYCERCGRATPLDGEGGIDLWQATAGPDGSVRMVCPRCVTDDEIAQAAADDVALGGGR